MRILLFLTGALWVLPAAAQTTTPGTIPGLENFSLPASRPTPTPLRTPGPDIAPLPRPTPTATATPTPAPRRTPVPRATPTAVPAPVARRTPAAAPSAMPAAVPTAAPVPAPSPTATAAALPEPTPTASASPVEATAEGSAPWPWWLFGGGGLIVVLAAAIALRRRRAAEHEAEEPEALELATPLPDPAPPTPAPPPPPPSPVVLPQEAAPEVERAQLAVELVARRAGTNLTSAAVDYVLVVRNTGQLAARAVRIDIRMTSASAGQEAQLRRLFDGEVERPSTPVFDLAPGETIEIAGLAQLPFDMVQVLPIAGRRLFVPLMAVNARYGYDGGVGQSAGAWTVGSARGGGEKLAPFSLDAVRMFDAVEARAVGVRVVG